MRVSTLTRLLLPLPLVVLASQKPLAGKETLSDIISASPFLSLHRAICEINSVTDQENEVGKWLTSFLESHNFTVTTQKVPRRSDSDPDPDAKPRLNIYAVPDSSKYGAGNKDTASKPAHPKVLLTSHIDTVPPFIPYSLSSAHPPTSPSFNRSQVKISGRGTVDAKACVAAQITVAMDLLLAPSPTFDPADLALLFVVDEESGGMGMRHFSDSDLYHAAKRDLKAVIFGEPTEGKLVDGHKGIFMMKVVAHGRAAHSGYPWLGRSANSMLLPALVALDRLGTLPECHGGLPPSAKFGNTTINLGRIDGGVAANVVAERAVATLAFRLAGGTLVQNKRLAEEAVRAVDPDHLLDVSFGQGYAPVNLDADVPGFDTVTVNYGTDVPNLQVADGVKRYLYGPGSIFVAHGADEGLTVAELEASLDGYTRLVRHALAL